MCECVSGCAYMLAHVFGAMQNNRFFNAKAWKRQNRLPTSASNPLPASPLGLIRSGFKALDLGYTLAPNPNPMLTRHVLPKG